MKAKVRITSEAMQRSKQCAFHPKRAESKPENPNERQKTRHAKAFPSSLLGLLYLLLLLVAVSLNKVALFDL